MRSNSAHTTRGPTVLTTLAHEQKEVEVYEGRATSVWRVRDRFPCLWVKQTRAGGRVGMVVSVRPSTRAGWVCMKAASGNHIHLNVYLSPVSVTQASSPPGLHVQPSFSRLHFMRITCRLVPQTRNHRRFDELPQPAVRHSTETGLHMAPREPSLSGSC